MSTFRISMQRANLPPELTDFIIDLLHDDCAALKKCAVVCQAWLPRSRSHLFHTLTIQVHVNYDARHTRECLATNAYHRIYVRSIVVRGTAWNWQYRLFEPAFLQINQASYPKVTSLHLENLTLPSPSNILALAQSLPNLKELICDCISYARPGSLPYYLPWMDPPAVIDTARAPHRNLKRVHLVDSFLCRHEDAAASQSFAEDFLAAGLHGAVEDLDLTAYWAEYLSPHWMPVLRACAPRLQHLTCAVLGKRETNFGAFFDALGAMRRLRTLTIRYGELTIAEGPAGTPQSRFLADFLPRLTDLVAREPPPFPALERIELWHMVGLPDRIYPPGTARAFNLLIDALLGRCNGRPEERRYPGLARIVLGAVVYDRTHKKRHVNEMKAFQEEMARTDAGVEVECAVADARRGSEGRPIALV